jgi:plastocyanin domain-containing protein
MDASHRIVFGIVALGVVIGAGILLLPHGGGGRGTSVGAPSTIAEEGRATTQNGMQVVDVTAQGGYSPRTTRAQAGTTTVIRMKTQDTYDCSSALVIPALGYQAYLPATGVTEISVPADRAQGTLEGLCSMGMYRFSIVFE